MGEVRDLGHREEPETEGTAPESKAFSLVTVIPLLTSVLSTLSWDENPLCLVSLSYLASAQLLPLTT